MKAFLLAVGTKVPTWIQAGFTEFNQRLPAQQQLQIIEVESPKSAQHKSSEERKKEEAVLLLKHIKPGSYLIALDEKGQALTSVQFSKKITALSLHFSNIYFVVGGADGLCDSLKTKADLLLSFSVFTFPHLLVRVLLAEQWYRAMMLIENHPYHRA